MRRVLHYLKGHVERLTGTRIYRTLPHGLDLLADLRRLLPGYSPRVVFDVGANIGQSAVEFLAHYDAVTLYCFEPTSSTFNELAGRLGSLPNVVCSQRALGSSSGRARVLLNENSRLNVLSRDQQGPEPYDVRDSELSIRSSEEVRVTTLTEVCDEYGVRQVDFLKIDTEGHDLHVLRGAAEFLDRSPIGIVQVEAGMNPTNDLHVPFADLIAFLAPRDYHLFGIYDQRHEWKRRDPRLRRSNLVFLHTTFVARWL